jgi:hypothetical protein
VFGRPVVKSLALGSSVTEMDPGDVSRLPIVRLGDSEEAAISEIAEAAAPARADADILEGKMAQDASDNTGRFTANV